MAKYDTRRRTQRPEKRGMTFLWRLWWMSCSFAGGYFTASFYDYAALSAWVNKYILSNQPVAVVVNTAPTEAQLPKPKFEFYTLLTQEAKNKALNQASQPMDLTVTPGAVSAATVTPAAATPASSVTTMHDGYWVQVGSFVRLSEAERMKETLAKKGFSTNIVTIAQNHVNWYRVVLGPFSSRMDAQSTQTIVARQERIVGMIRKMDN